MMTFGKEVQLRNSKIFNHEDINEERDLKRNRYSGRIISEEEMKKAEIRCRKLKERMFSDEIRKPCVGVNQSENLYSIKHFRPHKKSQVSESIDEGEKLVTYDEQSRLLENQKIKMFFR